MVAHTPGHPISNFPDSQSVRQDVVLQAQVEKCLQELANLNKTGTKIKSLRGDPVEVMYSSQKRESLMTSILSLTGWLTLVIS